ncbi:biotin-dependent carboxyltransferase family protein [Campylobacter troglodytis]|uniref:5-oxoprolinase subunit C family protein n=1 Tax=Campylobacter troglodytis TaxID=654363 RepID=UPI001157EE27|nr:biotin-dependent carboxyltransferase family protein [Campylobacter troglodytis]TQR60243.1 allophanate hydrolase [Campylobacter troglodytis]
MSIRVIEPSLNSSLQDLGRKHYAHLGISRSGAMDEDALILANILLGNKLNEAGVELCFKGGAYEFLDDHFFVLSGAEFEASLEDERIQTYKVYRARRGDILRLKFAKMGFRGYLCLAGGFEVEGFLGSKSSDEGMGVGAFEGRNLRANDILLAKNFFEPFNVEKRQITNPLLNMPKRPQIRVLLGSNEDAFTQKGLDTFLNTVYTVSTKSSRMAIYCEASSLIEHKKEADIITEAVVFGSIQVPKSGLPIILMANRQSTGGYTKIATVIQNDLSFLAQMSLGAKFSFKSLEFEEALSLYKARMRVFKELDGFVNLNYEELIV